MGALGKAVPLDKLVVCYMDTCARTGKKQFHKSGDACAFLSRLYRPNAFRAYRCRYCNMWHTTSQDRGVTPDPNVPLTIMQVPAWRNAI